VIDSSNVIEKIICEGSTYTLPGNTVVKNSGTYFVVYKTAGGCDSIKFYKIKVDKNPNSLSLGKDICFENNDSITLKATEGYDDYYWLNEMATPIPEFTIGAPGAYHVRVTNSCGSKTDSILVFKDCDFPIFIPTGFYS
jgi:hypothetical protein